MAERPRDTMHARTTKRLQEALVACVLDQNRETVHQVNLRMRQLSLIEMGQGGKS